MVKRGFNSQNAWLPSILLALCILGIVLLNFKGIPQLIQILGALILAITGGYSAGTALSIFLSRETNAKPTPRDRATQLAVLRARQPPAHALQPQDGLEALPEIDRDRARAAAVYGVVTIEQLAKVDEAKQAQLIGALGQALFTRSVTIARDCLKLSMEKAK